MNCIHKISSRGATRFLVAGTVLFTVGCASTKVAKNPMIQGQEMASMPAHPAVSGQQGTAENMGAGAQGQQHVFSGGEPGREAEVTRTIKVKALDNSYNKKLVRVRAGETVRFVVENQGELLHELTIGAPELLQEHQTIMLKLFEEGKILADRMVEGAAHAHPNSVIVNPGQTKTIVWKFKEANNLSFACTIPGHFEDGMYGRIDVVA